MFFNCELFKAYLVNGLRGPDTKGAMYFRVLGGAISDDYY